MSGRFNPAALHLGSALLADEVEIITPSRADALDVIRRVGMDVERKCAGIRLAARVIGMATATGAKLDDQGVLASMAELLKRVNELRRFCLKLVAVGPSQPEFPLVFNELTGSMLDVATEEWRWSTLTPERSRSLPPAMLAHLLELMTHIIPDGAKTPASGDSSRSTGTELDLALVRRLALIDTTPRILALLNFFDYFQRSSHSRDVFLKAILNAILSQAEAHTDIFLAKANQKLGHAEILKHMFQASALIFCETYKRCAQVDVERLRALPELERSYFYHQYEEQGLGYEHVIDAHADAMESMAKMADVYIETMQEKKSAGGHQ